MNGDPGNDLGASFAQTRCLGVPGLDCAWAAALVARLYTGGLAGLFLSLGLSRIVWLEMRVETGLLVPICALALAVLGRKTGWSPRPWALLAAQAVLAGLFLAAGSFDPACLAILPAALVRDGFGLSRLPLAEVNRWLLAVAVLGNLACAKAGGQRTV